ELQNRIYQKKSDPCVIIIECYHGVIAEQLVAELKQHIAGTIHFMPVHTAMLDPEQVEQLVYPYVTDDPVFGRITSLDLEKFFHPQRLEQLRQEVKNRSGITCIYGTGASLAYDTPQVLLYADMPRWEI